MKLKNMNTKEWTPEQRIAWFNGEMEQKIRDEYATQMAEVDEQGNPDSEIQAMIAEDMEANNYYKD